MTSTQVAIPQGMALPAHLQGPDVAAQIAAANAAAAGGIKTGGFPRISIKGGKFHEVDGGETKTYFAPQQPGQPQVPLMCLESVIIDANPNLVKTFYPGDFKDGDDSEPACSSDNGVTPDPHIAAPQSSVCATCPQNQWGSKVSKSSGKDVKACTDSKRLAVLPSADLSYKALGLAITPAALTDWGKYVKALSERGIPVNSVVTNITFDHTASFPKLQFAYNRFLTAEEYAKVQARALGDDVKAIVAPTRQVTAPALAAPVAATASATVTASPVVEPVTLVQSPPAPVVQPAPNVAGFGAAAPATPTAAPAAMAPVASEPAKRTRRTREQVAADKAAADAATAHGTALLDSMRSKLVESSPDLSHLPPAILAAVQAVGADSPAGQALLAQFPAPAATQPAAVQTATPTVAAPVESAPAAAPVTSGFGAATAPVVEQTPPTAQVTAAGLSLQEILKKKLGLA